MLLPCLTMISWGETGADVSVACTWPSTLGLAKMAIDQTAVVAAITAIAASMMILRISCHPCGVMNVVTAFAYRQPAQREALHTGWFFMPRYIGVDSMGPFSARERPISPLCVLKTR